MDIRVICPHCQMTCVVWKQFLNMTVHCAHCARTFTPQAPVTTVPPPLPLPVRTSLSGPRLEIGSATSLGRVRNRNEDSFLVQHLVWSDVTGLREMALLSIADGMGGYDAGHEASSLVIRAVAPHCYRCSPAHRAVRSAASPPTYSRERWAEALKKANLTVYKQSQSGEANKGMGAAVVLVLIWEDQVLIGHVGDCRVYLLRAGQMARVTQDHTLVARMVQLGQLTAKEAESHPRKNELTQAVGRNTELKPDLNHLRLTPGDGLVLACDGLHADLDERALVQEMLRPAATAAERARRLVEAANDKGGSDNCTVIAVGYR